MTIEDTSNDEMIARALAASEEEMAASTSLHRTTTGGNTYPGNRRAPVVRGSPIVDATIPTPAAPQPSALPSYWPRQRVQMCHVPCVLGSNHICMEMMVDTGAETSVMSLELAKRLGLDSKIDTRERGIASGVGQAAIVGKLRGVICTLGHVEFPMDFAVLDVRQSLLILGMDQLRHYTCIIDLHKDALIFGGPGGVEVPLLPPDQQHAEYYDFRNACTIS